MVSSSENESPTDELVDLNGCCGFCAEESWISFRITLSPDLSNGTCQRDCWPVIGLMRIGSRKASILQRFPAGRIIQIELVLMRKRRNAVGRKEKGLDVDPTSCSCWSLTSSKPSCRLQLLNEGLATRYGIA
jgi:hypothetical protein